MIRLHIIRYKFKSGLLNYHTQWLSKIVINLIMQQQPNEYKTMYIKFPTVTKLQYPIELVTDSTNTMRSTQALTFRQNYIRKTQIKLDLIKAAESFKIIQLPQKEEIMNICTMTFQNKQRKYSPKDQNNERLRKKIFSVTKLNTFSTKPQSQEKPHKNPFSIKSSSIKDLRKLSVPPPIFTFDHFEVYPQFARLIALSYGVVVFNQGGHKLRKSKVDFSNNGLLIKQIIKKRIWWMIYTDQQMKQFKKDELQPKINCIWTPQILTNKLLEKVIQNNHNCFAQITNEEDKQIVFQRSFDKILTQLPKMKQLFFTQWQPQPKIKDWITQLSRQNEILRINPDQLVFNNHLPNHWEITNKKLLYKNMFNYYKMLNVNPFTKIPKTHHITCFNWQDVVKDLKSQQKIWILKPGQFTNRGNGISIFRNTKQALEQILSNPPKSQQRTLLLQEYISPMLYQQRKFDIRCYMLGVQVGNCLKFFWYEQGYIRTASQKFSTRKVCKSIHLTNDAVQKHTPNYDKYESANKLSYNELSKYCMNHTTFNFYQQILPEMKKMTRDICHAVGDKRLIGAKKGLSFEIYGLDFLVDQHGKPWLCQVNTNPSLQICCSLLSRIIPDLLQNTFRLVLDIFLPPAKKTPQYAQSFLTTNKYSIIYSNHFNKQ